MSDIGEEFIKFILKNNQQASCLHADDTMTKYVDGEFVRKPCVGRKDWSHDWIENVKVEDIDTRYFNLDYTRKKDT
jgi:hypothetical protein